MPKSTSSWGRLSGCYSLSPPKWRDNPCTREEGQRKRWKWLLSPNHQPNKQEQNGAEAASVKHNGDRSGGKSAGSRVTECKGGGECPGWRRMMESGEMKEDLLRKEWCCWDGDHVTQQRLGCRCVKRQCGEGKARQQLGRLVSFLHCGVGKPLASSWSPVSATYGNRSPQPETPSPWGSPGCPGAKSSGISSAGPSSDAFVPPE